MSKCRPGIGGKGAILLEKGVILEEAIHKTKRGKILSQQEEVRYVVLKIPYELLKSDKETQVAFNDIIHITNIE